jgi:hypothetical protein
MARLLLTVEDCFLLSGRGLVLIPEVPADALGPVPSGWTAIIRLRQPGGAERSTEATFYLEHFRPGGYKWMCYPNGAGKEDVPPGTEVWLPDLP